MTAERSADGEYHVSEYDGLMAVLRAVTSSTYIVNEKKPPSYDRKWKVHVLWRDGTTRTEWVDDNYEALHRYMRRLVLDSKAHDTGPRGDEDSLVPCPCCNGMAFSWPEKRGYECVMCGTKGVIAVAREPEWDHIRSSAG